MGRRVRQTAYKPETEENKSVDVVDYRDNKNLSSMQVSLHWWDAAHTSLHCHNHCEFFIITAGRTRHTLNGVQQTLEEGTLCLIRPQDVHQFAPDATAKCTHINISATPERLQQLCAALGILPAQLFDDSAAPLLARLTRDEMAYFLSRAQQVNYLMRDEHDRTALQLTISEMLAQGIALMYKKRMLPHDGRPQWLGDLLERLHAPELMACSANDVYRLAGYSAPVVIRNFKRHTGHTVRAYLVKLKLDWAVQLLRTTSWTVLEVSEALGYASLSHFGKLFTQHMGLCPGQFRARQELGPLQKSEKGNQRISG